MILFYSILSFIILQRLVELFIAAKNERWMKANGGIEVGQEHYKWFICLHFLFFISLIAEMNITAIKLKGVVPFYILFFLIFVIAQIARGWCIFSLGKFWNTKIIVIPKLALIRKGPYKYVKHPNYIIVLIELIVIPLMFGLYVTALLFPFFHLLLLTIRIPKEDAALGRSTSVK